MWNGRCVTIYLDTSETGEIDLGIDLGVDRGKDVQCPHSRHTDTEEVRAWCSYVLGPIPRIDPRCLKGLNEALRVLRKRVK